MLAYYKFFESHKIKHDQAMHFLELYNLGKGCAELMVGSENLN